MPGADGSGNPPEGETEPEEAPCAGEAAAVASAQSRVDEHCKLGGFFTGCMLALLDLEFARDQLETCNFFEGFGR